jgi:hypothetical protein
MVHGDQNLFCQSWAKSLSDKISYSHLVRCDGNPGISVGDHLMDHSLIICPGIFQVQGIPVGTKKELMHFGISLNSLSEVEKTIPEFLKVYCWSQ